MPDPYWVGAQICAILANANSAKGRHWKLEDFLPRVVSADGKGRRRQSTEEMLAIAQGAI